MPKTTRAGGPKLNDSLEFLHAKAPERQAYMQLPDMAIEEIHAHATE